MIISGIFGLDLNKLYDSIFIETDKRIVCNKKKFNGNNLKFICGDKNFSNNSDFLSEKNSFLYGKFFKKNDSGKEELNNIDINKNYWGTYVYLLIDRNNIIITIDLIGQLPIFYHILPSGDFIFSSEIEVLKKAVPQKNNINWNYIYCYLLNSNVISSQTAFDDFYEINNGCSLSYNFINNNKKVSLGWDPKNYITNIKKENIEEKIFHTLLDVLFKITKDYKTIFLDFSGGIDSSGILLFLYHFIKDKEIIPMHTFHPSVPFSDERSYVKSLSKILDLEVKYFSKEDSLPFTKVIFHENIKPNWPSSIFSQLKIRKDLDSFSNQYNNFCFLTGRGGDHIFMKSISLEFLSDYIIDHGFSGFFNKIKDFSTITRVPFLSIVKNIFFGLQEFYFDNIKKDSRNDVFFQAPWMSSEILLAPEKIDTHPFFLEIKKDFILPGKKKHIEIIYKGLSGIKSDIRCQNTMQVFHPFYSQPLIELALSIKTFDSFESGYDRFFYRNMISKKFNAEKYIWRKDKSETSGIFQLGFKKNKDYIIELCMDGQIIKNGFIDKNMLYKNIKFIINGQNFYQWQVMNLICAEIFLNVWS